MRKKRMMIFALLFAVVQGVWAEPITYIEKYWDAEAKEVKDIEHTIENYIKITQNGDWKELEGGKYYYFTSTISYTVLHIVGKDVHIILGDNCTINLKHIKLEDGYSLHIHTLKDKSGKIHVYNDKYKGAAGIGGGSGATSGSLYIHDGEIKIDRGLESGAGIGGGNSGSCGDVVIYGGTVAVESGVGGAGIGGGEDRGINLTNSVTIYGGDVTAEGTSFDPYYDDFTVNKYGAGIGGGDEASQGGPIYIYGGTVTANTKRCYGAGIGGGYKGNGGTVVISGGTVNAYAQNKSTAIGAGYDGNGGNITITGGTVVADTRIEDPYYQGDNHSVGMGTFNGEKGSLTITGGNVWVNGYDDQAIKANVTLGYVRITDGNYNVECDNRLSFVGNEYTLHMNIDQCVEHEYVDFRCKWCGWFDSEGVLNSWGGDGTAEDPYLIETDADWRAIHSNLMYNKSYDADDAKPYEGKHFLQTVDISTSQGIGVTGWNNDKAFCGIYDGGGHQLNCTIANPENNGGEAVAPFHLVKGATIKNLYVSGTVNGGIHSAGLVAFANGTVIIDKCRVSAEITCTGNTINDAHGGGIVGHALESDITVSNSVFDGTLTAKPNGIGDIRLGAIVGWSNESCIERIENCIENGEYNGITDNAQTTFCRKDESTTKPDYTLLNVYISDLGHGDGAYKGMSVTSGNKGLELIFDSYDWKVDYLGALSKANGTYHYIIDGTFYTINSNDVSFSVRYPESWNNPDIFANGTKLEPKSASYTFKQGGDPTVITAMVASVELSDNSSNDQIIELCDGMTTTVTLSGRTLYKDGNWNTLCLPFKLDDFTGTALANAEDIYTFSSASYGQESKTLTLDFVKATTIEAGKPYIVKWTKPDGYDGKESEYDVTDPIFKNVTFSNVNPADCSIIGEDGYVEFIGTYNPISFTAEDKRVLFMGAGNTLYYPLAGASINAFRGYFQLKNGLVCGEPSNTNNINSFELNFDGESTGIFSIENGRLKNANETDAWHTLDGRQLNSKPTTKGIYINNGRKVIIK